MNNKVVVVVVVICSKTNGNLLLYQNFSKLSDQMHVKNLDFGFGPQNNSLKLEEQTKKKRKERN